MDSQCFTKRLVLTDTVIDYDEEDSSVGCLRVVACEVVDKVTRESSEDVGVVDTLSPKNSHLDKPVEVSDVKNTLVVLGQYAPHCFFGLR